MKKKSFALEYIRHPKQLGTPTQSSRFLVKAVIKEIIGKNIIELGAGKGPITKGILKILPKEGQLTCLELNSDFCRLLKTKYSNDERFKIANESAERLEDYLEDIDCIVSGLPLTSMNPKTVNTILNSSKNYRFIQYKYFPSKKLLENYFSNIKTKLVPLNIPPAVIYTCSNNRLL